MLDKYSGLTGIFEPNKLRFDEPMAKHTTIKVGGPCDAMVIIENIDDIQNAIKFAKENNIFWMIMGNGSNMIVKDDGIRGLVIKITNKFSNYIIEDDTIIADSGLSTPLVSFLAKKNLLSGLEFACGIPGTVGGGVRMNAGAYGGQFCDVVESVDYLDENGDIKTFSKSELKFSYRHSIFSENRKLVILSCKLKLTKSNYADIDAKMTENNSSRQCKQPLDFPSAGSVFKRPAGYFVGKLIDEAGLRGYMLGGAQVSEKHTGFIINKDHATAKDILDLIEYVKTKVYEKHGIMLETEVEIIGGQN